MMELLSHKKFLEKISKMLDNALDVEVTDAEESIETLYEISELIEKEIKDFQENKLYKKCERCHAKKFDLEQKNKRLIKQNSDLKKNRS